MENGDSSRFLLSHSKDAQSKTTIVNIPIKEGNKCSDVGKEKQNVGAKLTPPVRRIEVVEVDLSKRINNARIQVKRPNPTFQVKAAELKQSGSTCQIKTNNALPLKSTRQVEVIEIQRPKLFRQLNVVNVEPPKSTSQVKIVNGEPPKPTCQVTTVNAGSNVLVPRGNFVGNKSNVINNSFPGSNNKFQNSPRNITIVDYKDIPKTVFANISLKLLTARTILISVEPKCTQFENMIKQFKTARFMHDQKMWSIGWEDHQSFSTKIFRMAGVKIKFSNLPDFLLKMFAKVRPKIENSPNSGNDDKNKKTYKEEAEARIEKTLLDKMFPYQKRGLEFGLSMHGKVYIADEMGLGKSIQGLAIARYYKNEWPLLIVCPAAVRYSWRDTFYNFLPDFDKSKIFLIEKNSDFIPLDGNTSNVIIISYTMLKRIAESLNKINGKVIIFDEAHSLKSKSAARTKQATTIARTCSRIILLSGTPALSKPIELYSQLYILNSSITPNYYKFAQRYCDGKQGQFGYVANGSTNPDELKAILSTFFMIRRYKKDVLNDLPEKMRQVVYLRGDIVDEAMKSLDKEKKELDAIRNKFEKTISRTNYREKKASIIEYFSKTGVCKSVVAVKYIMEKYFSDDVERRKIIIFAHHKIVLDKLEQACENKKIKSIRIDGSVTGPNRDKAIKDFQSDDTVFVAILSTTAAGAGVTLTAASVVIFAELHWNPGYLQQAEDRAHRIGQKNCVNVYYLIFTGTCDDYLFPLIQNKMKVLGELTLNNEDFKNSVKKTEFITRQKHITDFFSYLAEEEGANSRNESGEPDAKKLKLD